jgi:hypothetical protein
MTTRRPTLMRSAHMKIGRPDRIVADADLACGLDAEFGPRVDEHIRSEAQARLANAAKRRKLSLRSMKHPAPTCTPGRSAA